MRPKLRTLIIDVYRDVTYALDDDGYTTAEYQDLVRKRFVKAWEGLIDGYKVCAWSIGSHLLNHRQDTFTQSNYRLFFGLALDVILKPWEKAVLGLKYTEVLLIHQLPRRPQFTMAVGRDTVRPRSSLGNYVPLISNRLWGCS